MLDGGRIVGGLAILALLGAGPTWLALAGDDVNENEAVPTQGSTDSRCVRPGEQMREEHPALLADWREQVVRFGQRVHHTDDGRDLPISLTGTCLGCHGSASGFCDRCHARVGVSLSCWQCHSQSSEASSSANGNPDRAPQHFPGRRD